MTGSESTEEVRGVRDIVRRALRRGGRGQVAANTAWILTERVVTLGTSLVASVLLARYLGTEQFGLLNYALAIVAIVTQLARFGMSGVLVRELVLDPAERGAVLGTALGIRLVGSIVSIVCVVVGSAVFLADEPVVQALAVILSIGLLFDTLAVIESHYQGLLRNRVPAMLRAMVSLVSMVATVTLVFLEAPLIAFAVVTVGESALLALAFAAAYRRSDRTVGWSVRGPIARRLMQQSWPLILSSVTASIYLRIDQVMLGAMTDGTEVGIYAAAVRLSEGWYFIPTAIATAAFPLLLNARSTSAAAYERRTQLLYDALFWAALLVVVPVSVFSNVIVGILYGPEFAAAGPILAVHVWAGIFIFLRAGLSKWLIAEQMTIFSLVTHGSGAVINILLNLWLIPRFGAMGAALATLVSYAVASYFALFVHPRTRRPAIQMTKALMSPIRLLARGGPKRVEERP